MLRRIVRRKTVHHQPIQWPDTLHPVLRRIYNQRALTSSDDLNLTLNRLLPYSSLKGINDAVLLLAQALFENRRIIIVGDFDADGATSTAVALRLLRAMGANEVDYIVPDRFRFGYGLSPQVSHIAHEKGAELLVTVDNGISSLDGVATARDLGMLVLVTDHHLAGDQLPNANAIVNPNQPGDEFQSKALAGVGVIFYTLLALRTHLRDQGWFSQQGIPEPNLASVLDIVALGTVADVVPLDTNNRILVEQGLRRIRAGQACPGIQALLQVAKKDPKRIVASDLGFFLGPRLNAAGRLEDMSIGIECLGTDSLPIARDYASQLDLLNQERKQIEQEMKSHALSLIECIQLDAETELPNGICLFDESWHQGVIGILASRIKDKYHRPVVAFAPTDNDEIKGSARSIEGVHIRDVLDAIATKHPKLLTKFGGHAMAAGLSLNKENLMAFGEAFDIAVNEALGGKETESCLYSDGELQGTELTLQTAEAIRQAGPWGQAFPEPVFDGMFTVVNNRVVGERHLKLQLKQASSVNPIDAIAFFAMDDEMAPQLLQEGATTKIAYRIDVNEFRGQRTLQLCVEALDSE